ncbi:hypothetical protein EJB05_25103 [Eragrostis curvula]|uniref:Uncharacterized protein n=1 Tax=Eragrostis curvula TaxID=38414 RepID=A0A5J9VB50_9POAL|nr:hypothetical protein EJB05_25103 [Eragrostis curvula]
MVAMAEETAAVNTRIASSIYREVMRNDFTSNNTTADHKIQQIEFGVAIYQIDLTQIRGEEEIRGGKIAKSKREIANWGGKELLSQAPVVGSLPLGTAGVVAASALSNCACTYARALAM